MDTGRSGDIRGIVHEHHPITAIHEPEHLGQPLKAAEQRGIKVLNLKSARAAKKREEEIMKKKEQKAKGKKEEKKPVEAKQEPKDGEKMKHEEKK